MKIAKSLIGKVAGILIEKTTCIRKGHDLMLVPEIGNHYWICFHCKRRV